MRRIGMALSANRVWATVPVADMWADAPHLVRALVTAAGPRPAHVHVALLPDLCHVRHVPLPSLKPDERRTVLARTMTRHIPRSAQGMAFGTTRAAGGVLLAASPAALIAELERAFSAVGWRATFRSAVGAWAAADRSGRAVVSWSGGLVTVASDARGVTAVRRLPAALADRGPVPTLTRDTELVAARHAASALGPEIVTDNRWTGNRARRHRTVRLGFAAAAALAIVATAAVWRGDARELAELRSRRAAHAAAVAEALDLRERVTAAEDRLALLAGGTRAWSAVLHDVGDHLPRTAFLSAFRAAGDSLSIEGYAREAAPVLDALRTTPSVAALRATAPIRRETRGDQAVERFVLGARLRESP